MKKAFVCRTPASFVSEVGRYVLNEAGDYRKKKGGLRVKVAECCPGKLDSMAAFSMDFLCDVSQVL